MQQQGNEGNLPLCTLIITDELSGPTKEEVYSKIILGAREEKNRAV